MNPEIKADILCSVMCITRKDLDSVIANHSEVSRTIKGHAFEVVFDAMMTINDIHCIEVGGDTDVDRIVNDYSLQLKTPYVNGCSEGIVSYKTHKTHGAKSQTESVDYYHKVEDFADFLVGLVSYEPFTVLIVPKESLPRVSEHSNHIQSPMYLNIDNPATNNNFKQLDITRNNYVRFQIKGLTWNGTTLDGIKTTIDCESQLSRGRVNDHPTQSRLYKITDFENLIIAIDPPYSNTL